MKLTLCGAGGCYKNALPGCRYCSDHKILETMQRPVPVRRKSKEWHYLYNTSRWKYISRSFLAKYPICFICGEKATIADHIIPHRGDVTLFYDENNLQPLCKRHHDAKTLRENDYYRRPGRGAKNRNG